MRGLSRCTFAMLITLAACSGKKRPFADGAAEALGGSAGSMATTTESGDAGTGPGLGPKPAATEGVAVDTLEPPGDAVQGGGNLACEADAGACTSSPDAGPAPATCIASGPRDCTSEADNDCDGQPDNTVDEVCVCLPGAVEPCDEHPGLDGRGPCSAGTRTCVGTDGTASSEWGACEGAQGPQASDSCVPGDDGDCDGVPNEGCDCVDGFTQPCGPATDLGICQRGTQTCVDGSFGDCVGEVFGTARDCRSNADNDCDGRADNIRDNVCTCTIGQAQPCQEHPQDGVGRCRAGSQQCLAGQNNSSSFFGACSGSVGPAQRDACTSVNDDDCDGLTNDGCQCVSSRGNADCSGTPDTARCNGATGQCVPCQSNPDCSLVSGGRNVCQAGRCVAPIRPLGEACTAGSQCESEVCDPFYRDNDRDGYAPQGAVAESFCSAVGFTKAQYTRLAPTNIRNTDCLDTAVDVNPGQGAFFADPSPNGSYDYNCNGTEERDSQTIVNDAQCLADGADGTCNASGIAEDVGCGEVMVATACIPQGPSTCRTFIADGIGARRCR
jgi:hypothetical protein